MKAIVYYPKDSIGQEELARKVAVLHAEIIIDRINKLAWSKSDKMRLFDAIITVQRELAESELQTASKEENLY